MDLEEMIDNIQDKESRRFDTKKLQIATDQSTHEKDFAELAFMSVKRLALSISRP